MLDEEFIRYRFEQLEEKMAKHQKQDGKEHAEIKETLSEIKIELGKQNVKVATVSGFIAMIVSALIGNFFKRG